jgi:hypothetical protein
MKPTVTNIVPVRAMLGSVNVASHWNVLDVSSEGNGRHHQLYSIKTNTQVFEEYRLARNLLFMRCICT